MDSLMALVLIYPAHSEGIKVLHLSSESLGLDSLTIPFKQHFLSVFFFSFLKFGSRPVMLRVTRGSSYLLRNRSWHEDHMECWG